LRQKQNSEIFDCQIGFQRKLQHESAVCGIATNFILK